LNEDAFDAAASAIEMAKRAAGFSDLEPATDREHLLEGRIWNPGPIGKDPARFRA
jgi:hypothetical protein